MAPFPFGSIRQVLFSLLVIFTLVGIGTVIAGVIRYIDLKTKKIEHGTHIWFEDYLFKRNGGGIPVFVLPDLKEALRDIPCNSPFRSEISLARLMEKIGNSQITNRLSLLPAEYQYTIIDIHDDILVEYAGESMDETGKRDREKFLISTGKKLYREGKAQKGDAGQ